MTREYRWDNEAVYTEEFTNDKRNRCGTITYTDCKKKIRW